MSEQNFFTSEKGTNLVFCENKYAMCICNRTVHADNTPCVCDCGGEWHYDENNREVPDKVPFVFRNTIWDMFDDDDYDDETDPVYLEGPDYSERHIE
jgi:hypothetical protein